jgi:hypothetical protein
MYSTDPNHVEPHERPICVKCKHSKLYNLAAVLYCQNPKNFAWDYVTGKGRIRACFNFNLNGECSLFEKQDNKGFLFDLAVKYLSII